MLRAEKEMRQRDKEEERMVQLEMARIRKQMREERERQRCVWWVVGGGCVGVWVCMRMCMPGYVNF